VQFEQAGTASGHVFRRDGKRGSVWYAKFRDPAGRQVQKRTRKDPRERGRVGRVRGGDKRAFAISATTRAGRATGGDADRSTIGGSVALGNCAI
jgi:hypothetical protein